MLRKFRPPAPIVVLATLSAVAVVVASVLALPVTLTVPPPVAVNAGFAPVLAVTPPEKLIVAPVFEVSEMPLPFVSLTEPVNDTVSPVRPVTTTELPEVLVIGMPSVMLPLPLLTLTAVPEAPTGSAI